MATRFLLCLAVKISDLSLFQAPDRPHLCLTPTELSCDLYSKYTELSLVIASGNEHIIWRDNHFEQIQYAHSLGHDGNHRQLANFYPVPDKRFGSNRGIVFRHIQSVFHVQSL